MINRNISVQINLHITTLTFVPQSKILLHAIYYHFQNTLGYSETSFTLTDMSTVVVSWLSVM